MKVGLLIFLAALVAAFFVPSLVAQTPTPIPKPQACANPETKECRKIPPPWTGEPQECKANELSVYASCEQLCEAIPEYCPTYKWPFDYGFCRDRGTCFPVPSIFGTIEGCAQLSTLPCATPIPTPTPTPIPTPFQGSEGDILWRPEGTNYVQGPWAVRTSEGTVYVGAHAGWCCPGIGDPSGFEKPYVMCWKKDQVTAAFPVIEPYWDTHEMGWGSVVRNAAGDAWIWVGFRTTKYSWKAMLETGIGNRARGVVAVYPDLMRFPITAFWDCIVPWKEECLPRNVCGDAQTIGPFMPAVVWLDGEVVIFMHDPDGTAAWTLKEVIVNRIGFDKRFLIGDFSWSDIALGNDGRLYALVSGGNDCWWTNCTAIHEYVSEDGGLNWQQGERLWRHSGATIGDACYLRDELGHINRDALTVIGLVTPSSDPTSATWYLHWWADPRAVLPRTWGLEPGTTIPRVRQHVERGK